MFKDFLVAFALALVWWVTGFPMSMPAGAAMIANKRGNEAE